MGGSVPAAATSHFLSVTLLLSTVISSTSFPFTDLGTKTKCVRLGLWFCYKQTQGRCPGGLQSADGYGLRSLWPVLAERGERQKVGRGSRGKGKAGCEESASKPLGAVMNKRGWGTSGPRGHLPPSHRDLPRGALDRHTGLGAGQPRGCDHVWISRRGSMYAPEISRCCSHHFRPSTKSLLLTLPVPH